jgi:anti-sigma regulatory factor (Ser/Thr protein kinase)
VLAGRAVIGGEARLAGPGGIAACEWAMGDFIELDAVPGAVPCARQRTRMLLLEWGLPALGDSAELVVSELVTNAVRAAARLPDPLVRLWLMPDPARDQVLVQVWDGDAQLPVPRQSGLDEEGGRGLVLVGALSADWGVWSCADGSKVIWAVIAGTGGPPGLPDM